MGVKDLWSLVSPTGEVLPLTALEGKAVAIDLSCWVVDCQALQLGHVARPHLRNLFFRTMALLNNGVLPVFVLEGDAPSMKWNTINSRNQRNFHLSSNSSGKNLSLKTGKRSRFKSVLKECRELLDMLGVPWVQAKGEAEATCAALNYYNMVEGVISQDSDVFLYGGQTVFRNFTANQSKATVEKFSMDLLEEHLKLTRGGLILLALLLGCDYFQAGVQGVGKDTAVRLLKVWYQKGVKDPVRRMQSWAECYGQSSQQSNLNSRKWKNGSEEELEAGVRDRMLATDGFPFTDIIHEFQRRLDPPTLKVKWGQPQFSNLVRWCIIKLEWEGSYAVEKISPVVTRWMVTCGWYGGRASYPDLGLMPVGIVKRCVRRGVAACQVKWRVLSRNLPEGSPDELTTDEPLHLLQAAVPALLQEFEEAKALKKGKGSKKPKKNEQKQNKTKARATSDVKKTKAKAVCEEKKTQVSKMKEEENTSLEEEDEDISLIIDRIIGIDLTGRNKDSECKVASATDDRAKGCKDTDFKKRNLKESTSAEDQERKCTNEVDAGKRGQMHWKYADEVDNGKRNQALMTKIHEGNPVLDSSLDNSDEDDKENQPLSLMDRISQRVGKKDIMSKLKTSKRLLGALPTRKSDLKAKNDTGKSDSPNIIEKENKKRQEEHLEIACASFKKGTDSSQVKSMLHSLSNGSHNDIPNDSADFGNKIPENSFNFSNKALEYDQNFEDKVPENSFDSDNKAVGDILKFEEKIKKDGIELEKIQEDSLDFKAPMDYKAFDIKATENLGDFQSKTAENDCHMFDKITENVLDSKEDKSIQTSHESQVIDKLPKENKNGNEESQSSLIEEKPHFTLHDSSLFSEPSVCKNQVSRDMFDDTGEVQGLSHSSLPDLNSTPLLLNRKGILRERECDSKALDSITTCNNLHEPKPLVNIHTASPVTWQTPAGRTEGSLDYTVSPVEPSSAKTLHQLQYSRGKERRFIHVPRGGCNSTPLVNTPKGRSKDNSYGLCFKLLDSFSCSETGESFSCSAVEEISAWTEVSKLMENSLNLLQDSPRGDTYDQKKMSTLKNCNSDISLHNEDGHDKLVTRTGKYSCSEEETDKAGTSHRMFKQEKENLQFESTKDSVSEKVVTNGKNNHLLQRKEELANTTFSPMVTGLSLAERIKKKCKDKAISKLIDKL
ncbi:uncharacterized protein LOC122259799 [Penaeus japonicus]|uniref:uncharacterized protein LOC122259799 n=1 Tax=Penaeus japonicus TaxID=27405 RepID=UPI001C70FA5C|nr:uncharacterized protein LOC122259799 [Penaeus japonicus]